MRPREKSHTLLSITRSKAKMYEYNVPLDSHITLYEDPAKLFDLTIGILGDFTTDGHGKLSQKTSINSVRFSSYFFDSYLKTKLDEEDNNYLALLGSTAYFLCDLPGSSSVLVKEIQVQNFDLSCRGLDKFLVWLLKGNISEPIFLNDDIYTEILAQFIDILNQFQVSGKTTNILTLSEELRKQVYNFGTDREILLADSLLAVITKKILISTWECLPRYSEIDKDVWANVIPNLKIKELWPAQRLLGDKGVYKGGSAVVQMPTSAGKTKATELILRSAFLSNRANLAVIVAPFKALCSEIHDDLEKVFHGEGVSIDKLSDSIQTDFILDQLLGHKQVVIVTPEKLDFILRHDPGFSSHIKLLIYDEGHLFDDGSRGVKYELLLSSLKTKIHADAQVVLISAVISNAGEIKDWLLNEDSQLVTGSDLTPTYRTIAFTSWKDKQLHFVSPDKPEAEIFFVPYVLKQVTLQKKGKERNERFFPEKNDGNDIALFLSFKLINQGSVAVYTGRKTSVSKIIERALEIYSRDYQEPPPVDFSDPDEIMKLKNLFKENFGEEYNGTIAAKLGIFAHHGDVPQGLRHSIEYALQNLLVKFVVCTSTLAQGVNLPLRYLIITNTRHSQELIKTRDFHNLLGRAGRSGMYTEGSIIFADPEIWDSRDKKWDEALGLLDSDRSEPCESILTVLFKTLQNYSGKQEIEFDIFEWLEANYTEHDKIKGYISEFSKLYKTKWFKEEDIKKQLEFRISIFSTIESYLLANLEEENNEYEEYVTNLAKETLAYTQLDEENQESLIKIFLFIANAIIEQEKSYEKRIIYSKTFRGVYDNVALSQWVNDNFETVRDISSISNCIDVFWPVFSKYITNKTFVKIESDEALKQACTFWMEGKSFFEIFQLISEEKVGRYNLTMEHVVSLCEGAFSFDGALLIGAIQQLLMLDEESEFEELNSLLQDFQKNMKYGLPTQESIILYELGFSDRIVAQLLAPHFIGVSINKQSYLENLERSYSSLIHSLERFPSYFTNKLNILTSITQ